jgi:hypothetical protein
MAAVGSQERQMRNCIVSSILAGVAAFAVTPMLGAQTAARPRSSARRAANPKADLSGIWMVGGGEGDDIIDGMSRRRFLLGEPPRLPWAEEQYQAARKGVPDMNEQGLDELDPIESCFPPSPARLANLPRLFEIIQFPNRVIFLSEWDHWVRFIWTDGRGHPAGYPTSFMGHSIGTWDKDTLVVDTVDLYGDNWIDGVGNPQTDAMHIVERFRRIDHDTLEIAYLFDDTKAYTKPWGGKKIYRLDPNDLLEHIVCQDHLKLGKTR